MLLVLRPFHMFVLKGPTKYGLCPFLDCLCALDGFFKTHFSQRNHEPCVHDAHIIFLFPVIILLAILTSRFLLFPHLGFLFSVRWPLADIAYLFLLCGLMLAFSVLSCSLPANFNSLVASEFLLLVGLYSQHTAHGTLSCSLVAAHCSP